MIEQALYFAVGFLVASLAAVVWTPVVSRRARRLSEARARLQAPLSEKQAIAERDALRAQHAVDQVRLERRLTLAEEASIALRSELGRQSVKVITLEADATEHKSVDFDRQKQIEELSAERRDLEVALGASEIALHDLAFQRDRAGAAEAAAISRQIELEAEASRSRARMAILEAQNESLGARRDDLMRSAKAAAEKAEAVRADLAASLAAQTARARHLDERLREAIALNESLAEDGFARRREPGGEQASACGPRISARRQRTGSRGDAARKRAPARDARRPGGGAQSRPRPDGGA